MERLTCQWESYALFDRLKGERLQRASCARREGEVFFPHALQVFDGSDSVRSEKCHDIVDEPGNAHIAVRPRE